MEPQPPGGPNTQQSPPTRLLRVCPVLATDDMERTLNFYRQVLGFDVAMRSPEYAIIERDGLLIHFQNAASESVMEAMRKHTEIYIEVQHIGLLWLHVAQFKSQYRVRELFDREYGMREFHIADPNGVLIFVGEQIGRAAREFAS